MQDAAQHIHFCGTELTALKYLPQFLHAGKTGVGIEVANLQQQGF